MENEYLAQEGSGTYVVFRVKENLCSIPGQYVAGIEQLEQKLMAVPKAPAYVRGSFNTLGSVHTVVDLRAVFDWQTSRQAYDEFKQMIETRKQDHTNWVETLKSCRESGKPFTLARDCHQCALGRWRDNYRSHVQTIEHLFQELDGPHGELHELADTALRTDEAGEQALVRMESELVPKVLTLLDRMKTEFKESEFREMLLVIRGDARIALTVDEVLSVESLEQVEAGGTLMAHPEVTFVRSIQRRPGDTELIMELDIPLLTASLELNTGAKK